MAHQNFHPLDILIPLGKGSQFNDLELRYALRGVEKYLRDYDRVIIVGRVPEWIQNVVHVPMHDVPGPATRDLNIFRKIIAGLPIVEGKEVFFMNDDHFLLEECSTLTYPYYYQGLLHHRVNSFRLNVPYKKVLANTLDYLGRCIPLPLPPLDFDVHCPIIYNVEAFPKCFPVTWPKYGFAIKSMYCNVQKISPKFIKDLKFREPLGKEAIRVEIYKKPFFSVGDKSMNPAMLEVLEELYPVKSKYEL